MRFLRAHLFLVVYVPTWAAVTFGVWLLTRGR